MEVEADGHCHSHVRYLFKLWMGKKHDRQGPLAYILELPLPFLRLHIKKDEQDGY